MKSLFDINSPLMQGLSKVADIIILNILFMICCVPIFTIGAALTALHTVTMKLVRDEEGGIVKEFFRAFASNFRQATVIHLFFLLIAGLVFVDLWFVLYSVESHGAMSYILFGVAAMLGVFSILMLMYVYPLLAKFENSIKRTLQLAFILSIRHLPTTILLVAITAIPIVFLFIPHEIVIAVLFLMGVLGFAAQAMAQAFLYRKVFDQYIPQNEETKSEVQA